MEEGTKYYCIDDVVYVNVDVDKYPHAVEVTREQAITIEAGTHTVVNGEVVPITIHTQTLEEVKQSTLAFLDAKYASIGSSNEDQPLHISVDVDGSPRVFSLATGADDVSKFQSDLLLQKSLVDTEEAQPSDTIEFLDASGAKQVLRIDTYIILLSRYGKAMREAWQQYKALREAVKGATSVEQIQSLLQ